MIYAIHAVGSDSVKFGVARNVAKRLANLQIGSHLELRVLAEADWPDEAETKIHRLLRASHTRGEWFRLDKEVVNLIALMKEGRYEKINGLFSESNSFAVRRLRQLLHLTKEDLGVWRAA